MAMDYSKKFKIKFQLKVNECTVDGAGVPMKC